MSESSQLIVRDYKPQDRIAIEAIHAAQDLDYRMLDLSSPLVVAKSVCEENGVVVGATVLKIEAETYLFLTPGAAPALKWDAVRLMQQHIIKQAIALGIDQLVAYVPACIKTFSKRLRKLGWACQRDGWVPWSYEVKH